MANKTIALEASDASISTATISIKVVQVGKKQLTQSTFKQLPPVNLVDEERVLLTGVPWGFVRYYWGSQHEMYTHFLFQLGATLHRSLFWVRDSREFGHDAGNHPSGYKVMHERMSELVEALHIAKVLSYCDEANIIRGRSVWSLMTFGIPVKDVGDFWHKFSHESARKNFEVLMEFVPNPKSVFSYGKTKEEHEAQFADKREEKVYQLKCRVATLTGNEGQEDTIESIEGMIRGVADSMRSYRRRWDELMEKLRTVEQLFIAT